LDNNDVGADPVEDEQTAGSAKWIVAKLAGIMPGAAPGW
jgi:hypothetical protein